MTDTPNSSISVDEPLELWRHDDPQSTQMWKFKTLVEQKYKQSFKDYHDLHRWSVENVADFWEETWHFTNVISEAPYEQVLPKDAPMFPRPDFFAGAKLNFAKNLLYPQVPEGFPHVKDDDIAIVNANEAFSHQMTWGELRVEVRKCANALRPHLQVGDRVAGFLGNHAMTVVAMLAATSLGAIWTAVSPDTGVTAVLDRLVQIEPKILFADNGVRYNGKVHQSITKLEEITRALTTLQAVIIFETVDGVDPSISTEALPSKCKAINYKDFATNSEFQPTSSHPEEFLPLPPSHPLYILYSSGTTGAPKCIVHSALGTLLQHKKEHLLHCSITPRSRVFFYTTTTWMMWHWLVSSLASGATLVLYDGSPFHPHGDLSMPKLIEQHKVTHFGTSAKYLSILEQKHCRPSESGVDLSSLQAIYSTGSPLAPSTFRFVYSAFPPTINLGSITGGTDIVSLFGAPSPLLPVHAGEIQCAGLGMDIISLSPTHEPITNGEPGDLFCLSPFPCQPVTFWGVGGDEKYRKSYFDVLPGKWHHGDFVSFSPKTGGIKMLGRSDGVLKPAGVRFGSAEIYNVLLKHFSDEIEDALCIGRRRENDMDETVVLFCKMATGVALDERLKEKIRKMIRRELSARHVPGVVDECLEIPITTNGKKVEVAVKQILCGFGEGVKVSASVANRECLEWYREWARTH